MAFSAPLDVGKPLTGRITLARSETPIESTIGQGGSLLTVGGFPQFVQVAEKVYFGSMLMWSEPGFSQFAFDLIARMEGRYKAGRLSSLYGIGTSAPKS